AAVNGHAIAGGLITALVCDFRVAACNPARFGLNEVPIGIPMPAAYVEIIKYALGDQVAALATLRGKLYASRRRRGWASFTRSWSPASSSLQLSAMRDPSRPIATLPTRCRRGRYRTTS